MNGEKQFKVIEFLKYMGKLKHLPRTGWVIRDVPNCETVASHMYRMAMMTFLLENTNGIDVQKCLKMCLVHDMAESIVGDLTPHCGVSVDEKHRREEEAMDVLVKLVPEMAAENMKALFLEYESQSSQDAILVKELDRFDMICQAFEYEESQQKPQKLQEFFDAVEGKFKHPDVTRWVADLMEKRAQFQSSTGGTDDEKASKVTA